jgi:hypothetical protein
MNARRKSDKNSGQVLIITSLVVVMLLMAATLYFADIQRNAPKSDTQSNYVSSAYQVGATHTVISALSNFTNGGSNGVFLEDLNLFKSALESQFHGAILNMQYSLTTVSPYQDGVLVSWGTDGKGISSAAADFAMNWSGSLATRSLEFQVNITSELQIDASYVLLNESTKQAHVTFTVLNEGKPAQARTFAVYYRSNNPLTPGTWIEPPSAVYDFGNGTKQVSFTAAGENPSDPLVISVGCQDSRGIFVRANATCVPG